ncbi:IclR family transcriptional regulator [Haladaptatus pallidirubidus]|uniref:IclR family transcriptional regulator n=1 Tax=Haladaptatus pallidirubidus TaxID=1008152 RepID=A0AAV3UIX9_9EURY|nr:IclR family transcriptional regulator [Haladaptatus pallidirubidus]
MTEKANRPVKALLTMDEIISVLDDTGKAGVTEIAEQIDRPQSVVHDYLSTLTQLGYTVKIDGKYALGLHYLELGGRVRERIPLYQIGRPEIQRLAEESSSESVTLCVEENGMCVALDAVQSNESIKYDWGAGSYFHMHCSGAGKAMLANFPEERVKEILDEHGLPTRTENTITVKENLYQELEEVRERGVSFERGEFNTGMQTISAPILDKNGTVLGGLSVSGPAHRMEEPDVEAELQDKLLSTVNIIELNYNAR